MHREVKYFYIKIYNKLVKPREKFNCAATLLFCKTRFHFALLPLQFVIGSRDEKFLLNTPKSP